MGRNIQFLSSDDYKIILNGDTNKAFLIQNTIPEYVLYPMTRNEAMLVKNRMVCPLENLKYR